MKKTPRQHFIDLAGEDAEVLLDDLRDGHLGDVAFALADLNPGESRELLEYWLELFYHQIVQQTRSHVPLGRGE
jgi:hypothetical protein